MSTIADSPYPPDTLSSSESAVGGLPLPLSDLPLASRFVQNLKELTLGDQPVRVVVAFSGGLDSTVLLHLLRFATPLPLEVAAAHYDHRMREGSGEDADWTRGICRAWDVPLLGGASERPLRSESEAREARYAFLFEAAAKFGAGATLTAHHADDQAETVLFRILRGTGIAGLGGIPRRGRSGLLRPLLPFWREELEEYAMAVGLRWRTDPTNETLGATRNRIRLSLLPEIERTVSRTARRNLVSLAAIARESEAGWRAVVRDARRDSVRQDRGGFVLVRRKLAEYHPAVAKRVLRDVLHRLGIVLDSVGTRSALQFITNASSGREMQLPDGVRIAIELENARVERVSPQVGGDTPVSIAGIERGCATTTHLRLGGRTYRVVARHGSDSGFEADRDAIWRARFALSALRFPLHLRSRRPGDRVRTAGGTKSLKKLMLERRVPSGERASRPVLVDAEGAVVWIAGIQSFTAAPSSDDDALNLAVYDD